MSGAIQTELVYKFRVESVGVRKVAVPLIGAFIFTLLHNTRLYFEHWCVKPVAMGSISGGSTFLSCSFAISEVFGHNGMI